MQNFLIGRQQIVDRNLGVFAYELLFRDTSGRAPQQEEATEASNQVIVNSLLEMGLHPIVGPHRAFINFTRDNLLGGTAQLLPKDKVVIEVLETVAIDDALINAVQSLAKEGYMVALDDFVYDDAWLPLIKAANIIKLDILQVSPDISRRYIANLQKYKLRFLAEKVETQEQFAEYHAMGCDYFQGFLFSRPNVVEGRRLGTGQHAIVRLLADINRADIDFVKLADTISLDVGLSYKLLRYINNSSLFRLPQKVDSIHRAILCLGLHEVRRWASLVALASFPDTPKEVLVLSLARAKMCELLSSFSGLQNVDEFFLTGLMSMLDRMTGVPLPEIVVDLPLAETVIAALLTHKGPLGDALSCSTHYECWDLDQVGFQNLPMTEIGRAFVEGVVWANDMISSLQ